MTRRARISRLALVALGVAAACLDISSPVTGIASITPVIAPTPSVVVGDDSRDTVGSGNVQPLRVYAFGPNGDTIRNVRVAFFALDTTGKLRVDSLTGIAHGDSLSPNAQVVARVSPASGKGSLQTPALPFPVVSVPSSVSKDSNLTAFLFDAATADTLSAGLQSAPISVTVHAGGDTVVQKQLVSFELVRAPRSRAGGGATVVLVNDNGRASVVDTTDGAGHASRRLRLRPSAVETDLLLPGKEDTAIVRVHAKYKGELSGSPVEFIIPIRARP